MRNSKKPDSPAQSRSAVSESFPFATDWLPAKLSSKVESSGLVAKGDAWIMLRRSQRSANG